MLRVLIPSLTTTSPLTAISDKASASSFLVARNQLLGGDSNEPINSTQREKLPADAARGFSDVRQNGAEEAIASGGRWRCCGSRTAKNFNIFF